MKKRIFSASLVLAMLISMVSAVWAEPIELFKNDFNSEVNLWTAYAKEIVQESENNNYIKVTGTFANQGVLVQIANTGKLNCSEGNYTVFQFRTKISDNQTGIRFYRGYTVSGSTSTTEEKLTVNIDKSLRGISDDVDWVDVKIVYGDDGYITYINDVPGTYTTLATASNRFGEYSGHKFRFLASNGPDTATVYIDNLTVYDVPKTDVYKLALTGADTARIPNDNETEATEIQLQAEALDYINSAVSNVTWSLAEEYTGVSIDETGKLTVDNTADVGVITVNASAGGKQASKNISLIRENIASVSVSGDTDIPLKNRYETGTITRQYKAECLDFTGNITEASVLWSVENAPEGVTVDQNGLVTIADGTGMGTFDITASAENKKDTLTVTISEAALDFQKETDLINVHMNGVEVGTKAPNGAIMPNVYGLDNSAGKNIVGYVTPFEFVQKEEGDVCLKMTYPALAEQGNYSAHAAYFNQSVAKIESDIFVLSLKYKYNTEGTDTLRCELFPGSNTNKLTIRLTAASNTNLWYKHSIGEWNELKVIFNRNTLTCRVYMDNYLKETQSVSEDFWTTGIKQLRAIHCTTDQNSVPTDQKVHELYLDDYKVYVPSGITLESVNAKGMDGTTERNILNLQTGFDSWTLGSSPSLSGKELSVHLAYVNTSENAVKVNAIAGVYENGALKAVSGIEGFEIAPNCVDEDNVLNITLPTLAEDETFENYTMKVFAWYEDGTPFDYAFNMTNNRWNFVN